MGNKSVTSTIPVTSSTTIATASIPTTTTTTGTTSAVPSPIPSPTAVTTTTTSPAITTPTTTTASPVTPTPSVTTATATATQSTIAITTTATTTTTTSNTTNVTGTTPSPTVTSTLPATTELSSASTSTAGTSKPDFFSVAKAAIADAEKTKSPASSAYAQWYKWTKFEQQKREKGKIPWYMSTPTTSTDTPSTTTATLTMTTAKIGSDQTVTPANSGITVAPSFQLRSTAVYSPPHGDRILPGRSESIDTDTSVFKYLQPNTQTMPTTGLHTKATMYRMNTRLKKSLLSTQSSPSVTTTSIGGTNVIEDNVSLPTFISRAQQTDPDTSPKVYYYEKQQPQIVPVSTFTNDQPGNNGFYHMNTTNTNNQPVLAPVDKAPVWINDQPRSPLTQSAPSDPSRPLPPPSILKKSSTGLSQEKSNPLSTQTHDKVLEELRKRNKTSKDGTYRLKKIYILENNEPENNSSTVTFNLPSSQPPSKANRSISRSEKLLSG